MMTLLVGFSLNRAEKLAVPGSGLALGLGRPDGPAGRALFGPGTSPVGDTSHREAIWPLLLRVDGMDMMVF